MKKLLATASAALVASQFYAMNAFAELAPPDGVPLNGSSDVRGTIVNVLKTVLDFVTLLAVIFVVIAGIRLIISGGDEGEKDKAKKTIIYVIVGIIVILFARVIVTFFAGLGNT